jgi:hypothetical protein
LLLLLLLLLIIIARAACCFALLKYDLARLNGRPPARRTR